MNPQNAIRNVLIRLSVNSRTAKELMPSKRESYKGLDSFRSQIDYMKQVAGEGIQSALTDEEARIVRETVLKMFEGCVRSLEVAVDEATDLIDRTYSTFEQLED